nr:VCBS repeat-containing protein [Bacteroidota bacterium]
TYTDEIFLEIHAPDPQLISNTFTTTQGEEFTIDPGDHVKVTFEFYNGGTGMATGITGELSSTSPYVDIINPSIQPFGNIASHTAGSNPVFFEFDVYGNPPYTGTETIEMLLTLSDEFGTEWIPILIDFDKPDDIENILWESTHESISVYWDPILNEKGYNIYRSDAPDGTFTKLNEQIIQGFSGYTDYGLDAKTIYYYKVSCVSNSGIEGDKSAPEETWASLPYHADWPNKEINNDDFGSRTQGSPMTADFDADGDKEIYFTMSDGSGGSCSKGGIFGFYHDGEEIYNIDYDPTSYSGFFKYDEAGSRATPAIGDLDNDNVLELISTTKGDDAGDDRRKVFVHSTVGETFPELLHSESIGSAEYKGAVLSDIDGNGSLEIITKGGGGSSVYILTESNNTFVNYPGWPLSINGSATGYGMPVVADINNAGNMEIIFGFDNGTNFDAGIYIFNSDGTPYFSEPNGLFYPIGTGISDRMDCPVSIADIDEDGNNDIICVSGRNVVGNPQGRVFILNNLGATITGWEYDNNDHKFPLTNSDEGKAWLPVTSVGDINGDGDLEVLIASEGSIYIWKNDGSEFIDPIEVQGLEAKFIAPLIADVDEDNDMEIVVASNGSNAGIHCYDIDGERVLGWPLRLPGMFSTPCIDDIDNDGKNEIIATTGNEVHVWDTDGDAGRVEWGKYRHDSYNSGVYGESCQKNPTPLSVTTVTEWTENKIMQSDIIIEPSGKLTIYENVALPEDAKIIVKPGGELVLNGCR